jgi:hypothetical protein
MDSGPTWTWQVLAPHLPIASGEIIPIFSTVKFTFHMSDAMALCQTGLLNTLQASQARWLFMGLGFSVHDAPACCMHVNETIPHNTHWTGICFEWLVHKHPCNLQTLVNEHVQGAGWKKNFELIRIYASGLLQFQKNPIAFSNCLAPSISWNPEQFISTMGVAIQKAGEIAVWPSSILYKLKNCKSFLNLRNCGFAHHS